MRIVANRSSLDKLVGRSCFSLLGGVILAVAPMKSGRLAWLGQHVGVRLAIVASLLFVTARTLIFAVRLWRGVPLVEVGGDSLLLLKAFGRHTVQRADIAAVDVAMAGHVRRLEIRLVSGRTRRLGFSPDGTSWDAVVADIRHWVRDGRLPATSRPEL